jgi:hypothetical protein
MIRNAFCDFPRILLITLCTTHRTGPQTLVPLGCGKGCLVSWQFAASNEINNLDWIREITMLQCNSQSESKVQISFWG